MINLNEFRISFIWVQGFSTLAQDGSPMDFFNFGQDYESEFQNAKLELGNWKLPWTHRQGKNFWRRYLVGFQNLNDVDAQTALNYIVPMYVPSVLLVNRIQSSEDCRIKAEGFLYPYSVALVITATVKGQLQIEEIVDRAIKIHENQYKLIWCDGSEDNIILRSFAAIVLNKLWRIAYRNQEVAMPAVDDPFKIVTVISGTGDLEQEVLHNSEIHRILEGLCTFERLSEGDGVHPLDDTTRLRLKASQQYLNNNIIYGLKQSRAVWFPCYIKSVEKKIRKLGCYHRNLTFATLQTENLVALIRTLIRNQNNNCPDLIAKGINAAQILGLLYDGKDKDKMYRSWSIRKQIEDNGYLDIINQACEILNIAPILG